MNNTPEPRLLFCSSLSHTHFPAKRAGQPVANFTGHFVSLQVTEFIFSIQQMPGWQTERSVRAGNGGRILDFYFKDLNTRGRIKRNVKSEQKKKNLYALNIFWQWVWIHLVSSVYMASNMEAASSRFLRSSVRSTTSPSICSRAPINLTDCILWLFRQFLTYCTELYAQNGKTKSPCVARNIHRKIIKLKKV